MPGKTCDPYIFKKNLFCFSHHKVICSFVKAAPLFFYAEGLGEVRWISSFNKHLRWGRYHHSDYLYTWGDVDIILQLTPLMMRIQLTPLVRWILSTPWVRWISSLSWHHGWGGYHPSVDTLGEVDIILQLTSWVRWISSFSWHLGKGGYHPWVNTFNELENILQPIPQVREISSCSSK